MGGRKAERVGFALFVENLSRPAEFLGQWEQEKKRKRNREAGREKMDGRCNRVYGRTGPIKNSLVPVWLQG